MIIKIKSPNVVLKTKDKYLTEDIQILVDESVVNGEYSTLKTLLDGTKSTEYLFRNYQGESVDHLISCNDTVNVTTFDHTFNGSYYLTGIPLLDVRNGTSFTGVLANCSRIAKILMYGMKVNFSISYCSKLEAEALVTILSNCQVVATTQVLTMGSTLLAKLTNVYVKETGVELYEGITCRPCVICASSDEGAMLATDYFTGKGWTLA